MYTLIEKEVEGATHDVYNSNMNVRHKRNPGGLKRNNLSTTRCKVCGYSNDYLSKVLNTIHPCTDDKCCFRGPTFIPKTIIKEKVLQYNAKNGMYPKTDNDTSVQEVVNSTNKQDDIDECNISLRESDCPEVHAYEQEQHPYDILEEYDDSSYSGEA